MTRHGDAAYTVVVEREGDRWTADVPAVPGAHTWATTRGALDGEVRAVIALVLDLPPGAEPDLKLDWKSAPDVDLAREDVRDRKGNRIDDAYIERAVRDVHDAQTRSRDRGEPGNDDVVREA